MATNLFNKEHKAASDEYRKGYDRIRWNTDKDADKTGEKENRKE